MNLKALTRMAVVAAGIALAAGFAQAAEPANTHVPLQKTIGKPSAQAPVPSLGVINAKNATLADGKLVLDGIAGNVIVFADRPVRAAGHEDMDLFIARWGDGKDSFAKDPPNATISVLGGSDAGVTDAVVIISNPKLDGDKLTFDAKVLEGDLKGVKGPAALFIDWWAVTPGGYVVHGHHGWYGYPPVVYGAPYVPPPPPPACGYYPYPPCY
ncbi:hypothetical protein DK847_10135 [Aestuariivirga litoralis]|uniref:Uncharacterized protein n=1 Tax=Aestuariivirga litoralis TaxID=2650924 RepID=A0A2W2C9I2_9HYPH|nr:hypothetical protein [Aestuariivirga litoralis]PZF76823.1 hypothetical protein DK847_10135 [Aestuariivirga litoralis]